MSWKGVNTSGLRHVARASATRARQATQATSPDPTPSLRSALPSGLSEREYVISAKGIVVGCFVRFSPQGSHFVVIGLTDDGRLQLKGVEGYTLPERVEVVTPTPVPQPQKRKQF